MASYNSNTGDDPTTSEAVQCKSAIVINSNENKYHEELQSIFAHDQQVVPSRPKRSLTQAEQSILKTINTCLKNWHKPWMDTFLNDDCEFRFAFELMEGLLYYECQITGAESSLSSERAAVIAKAVARLVDYGNAILGIDLVIRANDDAFSETDPLRMTTIELFQAHMEAQSLREKLVYVYFKKDRPNTNGSNYDQEQINGSQSPNCLQVPRGSSHSLHPLVVVEGRSPRSPRGSTTSINSLAIDNSGRRTPSQGLPSPRDMDSNDLNQSVEITHMLATIKSRTFSASHSSTTRLTLLPGVLTKIESLLNSPPNSIKIRQCFELLDVLLDSIERLPIESRDREVSLISTALLKHLVRKVYVDDKDDSVQFQHAHWTTCLLSLVRLMGPHFNSYLKQFSNLGDLGAFLNDYLFVVKRLLSSSNSSNRASTSITAHFDFKDDTNQGPTYPDCWIEMTLLACSTFLGSLTSLYQILCQVFASNLNMWLAFIDCLVRFPTHESLRQNRLLMKERQKLLADDIRRTSAEYVWISWESLSLVQKQQLLEDLMEPLLKASIALHSKHRSVLWPIFYDMMRCDYTVQYITPRGSFCGSSMTVAFQNRHNEISPTGINLNQLNEYRKSPLSGGYQLHPQSAGVGSLVPTADELSLPYLSLPQQEMAGDDGTVLTKFTHLIVGKLNHLILDLKMGDESFTRELCAALSGDLNPKYNNKNSSSGSHGDTSQFKSMAKQTSDLISEFLQICMDCRHANRLVYKHLYLLCLFKLILFFRDKVDRPELYLTNLYKLSHLHHVAQRYVEAGYTLLEHAKSLPWSNGPLDSHYRVVTKFFNISQQQMTDSSTLKIFLYNTIMEYFDQGQNWEAAVPLCRELINYYEFRSYEYGKLAQQLDKMSSYFKSISDNNSRNNPEYFRVTFYGGGFPRCLKDMTVIYRGRPYEKLGNFQSTIISKYPDAKPLNTLAKPDKSILEDPEARYLQINACSPVVDLQSKFPGADIKKIREPLLNYYRHNCCDKFQFSRRVNRDSSGGRGPAAAASGDSFANMWRERTTLTTNTFPGMLPFFPVYLIETSIVSPIESAIEDLERTNDRLATMVNRFKADERHTEDVRFLGQLLLGVVDAAVNGGISKYEEAFFCAQPQRSSPSAAVPGSGGKLMLSAACNENNANNRAGTQTSTTRAPTNSTNNNSYGQSKPHDTIGGGGGDCTTDVLTSPELVNEAQVDNLKHLIAKQVPLLEEAIQLHRDRVAEEMRPQHEHLEASYKKLKQHITTKYYRYLPHDYSKGASASSSSTLRSYRSMTRSPRSTMRASESTRPTTLLDPQQSPSVSSVSSSSSMRAGRLVSKRMSDVGPAASDRRRNETTSSADEEETAALSSSIPYRQLDNERKSLPLLVTNSEQPMSAATAEGCLGTRRDSSRDRLANRHHRYEEISDENRTSDYQNRFLSIPKLAPRSSIKIKLPFGGPSCAVQETERELLASTPTSVSDKSSQYMHLIDCDTNEVYENDDAGQYVGTHEDENEHKQKVREEEGAAKKNEDKILLSGDEMNLVSF